MNLLKIYEEKFIAFNVAPVVFCSCAEEGGNSHC